MLHVEFMATTNNNSPCLLHMRVTLLIDHKRIALSHSFISYKSKRCFTAIDT